MWNIRTFRPSDAEAVRSLFAESLRDFAGEYPEAMESYIASSLADDLSDIPAHYLSSSSDHFWVVDTDYGIVGMVGIQARENGDAELRRMSVARGARRQGVGWGLLETTEAFCRAQGYRQIRLTTVTLLQPAIAMYRRFGYRQIGEEQFGVIKGQHFVKPLNALAPDSGSR